MPSNPLSSSEYVRAFDRLLDHFVDRKVGEDPFVGLAQVRPTRHRGPTRDAKTQFADRPPVRTSIRFTPTYDLREEPHAAFQAFLDHLVDSSLRAKSTHLQNTIIEATQVAGADLDGNKSLTWENYLRALERMELSFDDEGRVSLPKIYPGPGALASLRASAVPSDFMQRLKAIVDLKRGEWHAAQRSRRLP